MNQEKKDKVFRVLLIDDNPGDCLLIQEMLGQGAGGTEFRLDAVNRLEAGLRHLAKKATDVILLDLRLGDSEGIETFEKVNEQFPAIPIIILSGAYNDAVAIEAVRKGAQDYLLKHDINANLLTRTLRFTVERYRLKAELDAAKDRLEKLALIDPVTELFNRRGLQEILSREILRARRKHSNLLVLLVGLDDFKRINKSLGHAVGDVVLREVANKFRSYLRATDYVARVGGDEFLILLPETRFAEGMRVAEKVRLAISSTTIILSAKEEIRVTASLGLLNVALMSTADDVGPSIDDLMSRSHHILSKSKEAGRNRVSYAESYLDDAAAGFLTVGHDLSSGHLLRAVMQPIVHLATQREIGFEFLSRSTVKGFEMPDDFFRASLEANVLTRVDHQCLRTCVAAAAFLPPGVRCHVNLFPSTLLGVPTEDLLEVFAANGQKTSYCIEISEQQIIGDPSYLAETVERLKKHGILIAIDDLGFGRSCLESLILLEPDIIKIDKRCVTGIARDGANVRSLKRLLKISKSLGAEVVAEGIETREDLEVIRQMGVKYGQGYFLGRPATIPTPPTGSELLACE